MLTQEPRSWQGPGLQQLPEKILALKSGSLVSPLGPLTGCQNKQGHLITGCREWGGSGYRPRDGFGSGMFQGLTRDKVLISQNGSARPQKATSCDRGSGSGEGTGFHPDLTPPQQEGHQRPHHTGHTVGGPAPSVSLTAIHRTVGAPVSCLEGGRASILCPTQENGLFIVGLRERVGKVKLVTSQGRNVAAPALA